jgi:hypothetical protein
MQTMVTEVATVVDETWSCESIDNYVTQRPCLLNSGKTCRCCCGTPFPFIFKMRALRFLRIKSTYDETFFAYICQNYEVALQQMSSLRHLYLEGHLADSGFWCNVDFIWPKTLQTLSLTNWQQYYMCYWNCNSMYSLPTSIESFRVASFGRGGTHRAPITFSPQLQQSRMRELYYGRYYVNELPAKDFCLLPPTLHTMELHTGGLSNDDLFLLPRQLTHISLIQSLYMLHSAYITRFAGLPTGLKHFAFEGNIDPTAFEDLPAGLNSLTWKSWGY